MTEPLTIYVVVFSNYVPSEVGGMFLTRESAQKCCDELNEEYGDAPDWHVVERKVEP